MKKRQHRLWGKLAAISLSAALLAGSLGSLTFADTGAENNKRFPDYTSLEQAREAAGALNLTIAEEGDILLKNLDSALPMSGKEFVSVFGERASALMGADEAGAFAGDTGKSSSSISGALTEAGFNVNPTLDEFYANRGLSGFGSETTAFTGEVKNSFNTYKDAAVVVFARNGTEGSDLSLVTNDKIDAEEDTHLALYQDAEGNHYRHFMMLSSTEDALLNFVLEQDFDKVIVVINSSAPLEMEELENDDRIDAIVWIGRPGETGIYALAEILAGTVNPSGGAVDEWMADMTADPTWYNFGIDKQITGPNLNGTTTAALGTDGYSIATDRAPSGGDTDYNFIDYDEGIYLGYKYYETVYAEMYMAGNTEAAKTWWEENVTYPMGFGLSYTDFSFNVNGLYADAELTEEIADGSVIPAEKLSNSPGVAAEYDKFYVSIDVTNTGNVAGKKIVQAYLTAPYTEENKANLVEKSFVTLVGYQKTDLIQPGETQTVILTFNTQDMATWDQTANDGAGCYSLDAGDYVLRLMASSHFDMETDLEDTEDMYDEVRFTLETQALQTADDFSLCAVSSKFNDDASIWDEMDIDDPSTYQLVYQSQRTAGLMEDPEGAQVLLSRQNFGGFTGTLTVEDANSENWRRVLPKVKGVEDRTIKEIAHVVWTYYNDYNLNQHAEPIDKETDAWYISDEDLVGADGTGGIMADWRQNEDNGLIYKQMAGVTNDDTEYTINGETKTGAEWWTLLVNQLSWDELCDLVEMGLWGTAAIKSIDKVEDTTADSPTNLANTFQWACNTTISATWNTDLAYREGRTIASLGILRGYDGWFGSGMDTHRSAFSGRNNEYYCQDGIQGGYIAAAVTRGAEDVGCSCYVKHIAWNDQETNRGGTVQFVWSDEQTMRNNLKVFQMAMQEGGSTAAMSGYARACGIPNPNNYQFTTGIIQDEWNWQGHIVTDGYIGWINSSELDIMIRAGHNQELYTNPYVEFISGSWDQEARAGLGSVRITEGEVAGSDYVGAKTGVPGSDTTLENPGTYISHLQYYYTRECAQAVLMAVADTFVQDNGFVGFQPDDGVLTAATAVAVKNMSVAIDSEILGDSTVIYSATGLPEGLTLNEKTGVISGTAMQQGDYEVTVTYLIDSYIKRTAVFDLEVEPAFYIAEGSDDLTALTVGMPDVYALITSDIITTDNGNYSEVIYSTDSDLPAGLALYPDGSISGTPTEAGTFDVVVNVTATEAASNNGDSGGDSAGDSAGEAAEPAGDSEGDSAAEEAAPAGDSEGDSAEEPAGESAEEPAGDSEGDSAAEEAAPAGDSEGDSAAEPAAEEPAGDSEGDSAGDSAGGSGGDSAGGEAASGNQLTYELQIIVTE